VSGWFCFKCKEEMRETEVEATYLEIMHFVNGLKCPGCGVIYLSEKTVVEEVGKGEDEAESKLA